MTGTGRPVTHRHPRFAPEWQVKQFVAEVNGALSRFRVFTTGSDRYYMFQPLDVAMEPFPVLKTDLRDDVRSALRNGWGHAPRPRRVDA